VELLERSRACKTIMVAREKAGSARPKGVRALRAIATVGNVTQHASSVEAAYARLAACVGATSRITAAAELILAIHDQFYAQLCEYPYLAKRAFEAMDPHASIRISKERLGLYSRYISEHGPKILRAFPELSGDPAWWDAIDRLFISMIVDRYEADIAFSFAHSLRRNMTHGVWRPVAYSFPPPSKRRVDSTAAVYRRLPLRRAIDVDLLVSALTIPDFAVPFRDINGDADRILRRLELVLYGNRSAAVLPAALDVVEAGFFRDRAAFVVAR
jgi:isocitrate dehydrogenase kinase/phosphatase